MTFLFLVVFLISGIKDEIKPKYHALPPLPFSTASLPPASPVLVPLSHYHIVSILTSSAANFPILYPSLFRLSRYH